MRAKVLIDSYVTGMERAIFESSLFNVIPLVASHGSARDEKNFVLPKAYKWYVSPISFFVVCAPYDEGANFASISAQHMITTGYAFTY